MANDIKIGVQVSSGGTTDAEIKKAENLKRAFDAAQQSAARLGGTAGSRRVAAMASGGTGAIMSGQEYGQMRGSAGATGASARDFANQAQGLGGLVRLYATFAANIFAVSAAFTALKNAADVENLTKGLNTLGATSGQALGTLSKRLVEVTDGAISMREAMTSVAMTSSAGMSSKNIERLAMVAKNASLALGISMPDAINRLSRGIVKLEPELLDELGLFTKIGPATEQYALQIGKSATSLTDFERRQAFANAVLEEGERKFQALNEAAANPYDKLLASLKNVATSGLNVINAVLTPIVDLLAKSPTALLTGLVGVTGILIKQALPAIGQFKSSLQRTALEAGQAAQGKAGDALAAREQLNKLIERKVEQSADAQLKVFEDLEKKLYATAASGNTRRSSLWQTLKKDITDVSDADIAASEKSVQRLEDRAKKDPRLEAQAKLERATLEALKTTIKAEDDLVKVKQQNRAAIEDNAKATGQYARVQQAAADYQIKAQKDAIVANTAYNSSLIGIRGSLALAKEEIAASNLQLGFMGKNLLLLRVGAASLVGIFATLGAVINQAFAVLAVAGAVFSILDGVFSKNSKEVAKFDTALGAAQSSIENVARTLDAQRDKDGLGTRTLENTLANANAFAELNATAKESIKYAMEAETSAGKWDKAWDWLKSRVGMGREDKLAETIASQVSSAIQLLEREGLDTEFKQQLEKILNVQDLKNVDEVEAAFKKLGKAQREALGTELERANNRIGEVNSNLQSFKTAVDASNKSYKEYIQSLADNNPLIKLGTSLTQVGLSLLSVGDNVERLSQAFEYLAKSGNAAGVIQGDQVDRFVEINAKFIEQKRNIDATVTAIGRYRQELVNLGREEANKARTDTAVTRQQAAGMYARGTQQALQSSSNRPTQISPQEAISENIRILNRSLSQQSTAAIEQASKFLTSAAIQAFERGAELINRALAESRRQAQALVDKALQEGLTGRQRAEADAEAQRKDLQAQLNVLQSNLKLAETQGLMVDKLETANLLQQENNLLIRLQLAKSDKSPLGQAAVNGLERDLENLQKRQKFQEAVISGNFADLQASEEEKVKAQRALRTQATAGIESNIIKLQGQLRAVNISSARSISLGQQEDDKANFALQSRINQALLDRNQIVQSIAGISSKETVSAQITAENAELEKKRQQEILELNKELERLDFQRAQAVIQGSDKGVLDRLDAQITKATEIRDLTQDAQREEAKNKGLKDRQRLLTEELTLINRRYELLALQRAVDDARAQSALDYKAKEVDLTNELFDVTGRMRIERSYQLDSERASLDNQKAITAVNDAYNKQRDDIISKQQALGETESQQYKDLANELNRQLQIRDKNLEKINIEYSGKQALLDLQKNINLEQERYNEALRLSNSLTEGLKGAFGDLGEKIGKVGEALTANAIQQERNAKALEDNAKKQREIYESGDTPGIELINQEMALRKKAQRDELAGNIQLIGSAKGLFKEKTAAYKTLAAIEKALHIQKIAMDLKELATKLFTDKTELASKASTVATEAALENTSLAARIPTMITGIFGKITSQLGWFGPVVAAGIVAAIFGRSMSKTATIPKGFNAEEQQAVQGTGQQYVGGKLVERQGGVLGDVTLKADSITASLDKLSQEFFGSLGSSSSKIVQALEGIRRNTGDTVKALLGTISGFGMTGSAFGTVESSSKKLGGLWGSASTSIADAGVRISGTLDGLGRAIGQFEQYENVVRTSSSWFGLVKSTSTETNVKRFEESTTKLFANIFKSVQNVLLESAVALEGPASAAADAIKNIPVQLSVSLKGLTGEQAVEAVLAELSVALNQGAQQIFPFIEQYQRIGEEYYETVARIVKESETLTMGLSMVGIAIQGLGTQARIALEQQLIDQLGGVDKAVSSINFYYENFLTNEERFRIQFNQLTKTFRDAGKTLPQTKQEFINLLSGLDIVNNAEDQKTFALLINNAEKYNDLLELQKDILGDTQQKFKEFAKSLLGFKDSLLLGSATILTPIERYAKAKTEFETVRAKALAGDQESLGKLQDASQTFLNVSRELYASGQQYTADFNSVLQALDSAASYAQRQADMGQMQLDALNTQIGVLQNIERILTVQESRTATIPTTPTREEALSVIERTNQTLNTLSTAVETLSDFVFDKFDTGVVNERANGGYASGMTLVGERGPEFVDFTNPGQVYTAEQTRGMFAPRAASGQAFSAMVSELHELREEVVQLRKEQQKQTGDMIITNYDAQQKVADEIVQAVMQSVQDKSWQDKNKPTIN